MGSLSGHANGRRKFSRYGPQELPLRDTRGSDRPAPGAANRHDLGAAAGGMWQGAMMDSPVIARTARLERRNKRESNML